MTFFGVVEGEEVEALKGELVLVLRESSVLVLLIEATGREGAMEREEEGGGEEDGGEEGGEVAFLVVEEEVVGFLDKRLSKILLSTSPSLSVSLVTVVLCDGGDDDDDDEGGGSLEEGLFVLSSSNFNFLGEMSTLSFVLFGISSISSKESCLSG